MELVPKEIIKFEEKGDQIDLLGNKGVKLLKLWGSCIPIPYGFIISTNMSEKYYYSKKSVKIKIFDEVIKKLKSIEKYAGKQLGNIEKPLFLSATSSSINPTLGLTNTIQNIGIDENIVKTKIALNENSMFYIELYIRFIKQFCTLIIGVEQSTINHIINEYNDNIAGSFNLEKDFMIFSERINKLVFEYTSNTNSLDKYEEIKLIIEYILSCNDIFKKKESKTAIIIQEMVFGDIGKNSGSGIIFSRNPLDGKKGLYGYYSPNTPIQDIYSGKKSPVTIKECKFNSKIKDSLQKINQTIEKIFSTPQEYTFINQEGRLYVLETWPLSLKTEAIPKIAVDMVAEGIIDKKNAIMMIEPKVIKKLISKQIDLTISRRQILSGQPVSSGVITGRVLFDPTDIGSLFPTEPLILVRNFISPEDVIFLKQVKGILTCKGGINSHASIIAKGLGKCCVVGANQAYVDEENEKLIVGSKKIDKGDWLTIDGYTGNVYKGKLFFPPSKSNTNFNRILKWADEIRSIGIRANCDVGETAKLAIEHGAEGIGLCRTEHIFLSSSERVLIQRYLLSSDKNEKRLLLKKIQEVLENSIVEILSAMDGRPVYIRTFDFLMHEILPRTEEEINQLLCGTNYNKKYITSRNNQLLSITPMLGIRGCRIGIFYPDLIKTQYVSLFNAAVKLSKLGKKPKLSITIPFIMETRELLAQKELINKVKDEICNVNNIELDFEIGVMVEQPRTVFILDQIVPYIDFISFGTNDLTQLTFGLCRDNSSLILDSYLDKNYFTENPFIVLDEIGVGKLIQIGISCAKSKKPGIEFGICGEQVSNEKTISFCIDNELNYISCNPHELVSTRLIAAKATIEREKNIPKYCDDSIKDNMERNWSIIFINQIKDLQKIGSYVEAQEIARRWGLEVCKKYDISYSHNWKFIKRNIVDRWFGKREYKRFLPGWSMDDIFDYAKKNPGKSFRVSLFPDNIACHAVSYPLPADSFDDWPSTISNIDKNITMEIFPEPPQNNVCFRVYSAVDESNIEIGFGQAMHVFEAEQGIHPIVGATKIDDQYTYFEENYDKMNAARFNELKKHINNMIKKHAETIQSKCYWVRKALGVEYVLIEGYYDPEKPDNILICDIDLPLDIAFIVKNEMGVEVV